MPSKTLVKVSFFFSFQLRNVLINFLYIVKSLKKFKVKNCEKAKIKEEKLRPNTE